MRFSTVVAALLPVGAAFAETFVVKVGGGSLSYSPNQLTNVQNDDVIQFQFLDKNHTVTQSTFAQPCSNITDPTGLVTSVDSGYQFVQPNATEFPVWQITINNASAPLWFYCRQATHCQMGMVFAVNPTAEKSWDAFKALAAQSTSVNGSPNGNAANGTSTATGSSGSNTTAGVAPSGASAGAAAGTNSGAPSPSASTTGATGNGAGAVRVGAGASLLTLVGLSLGLLL